MPVSIRPLHPVFVGEVAGVDCGTPLSPAEVAAIEAGMDQYAILVFREQNITDEEQIAFTRHFGELESYTTAGHIRRREEQRLGPGMADFSNLDKDGRIMSAEDRVWFFKLGDRLWHSDSSFRPVPAKYSLLSGRVIPSWGANTEFADMRAAYDALDERSKAEVEELVCEHSPAARPHPPGNRAQVAVPRRPCRDDRRLDDPGSAHVPARFDRACHPARVRLFARVAAL